MSEEISKNKLEAMRHTAAHVLAAASQQLKPETRLGVGPCTETGFFHDIDVDDNWTAEDLPTLQKKMEEIKKMDLPIKQREVRKDEARELFKNDSFKLGLIDEIKGDKVGVSDMGEGFFVTLCEGDHAKSTGDIGHFKLTHLSGVYWRGDEKKPQLQRIFGVQAPTKKELDEYLELLTEAKKRDHRKLGKKLDLFTFSPLVGAGLPLFTPRGTIIGYELEDFLQSIQEPFGYQPVFIPHITKRALYEKSGHWDKFHEDLFHVKSKSGDDFVLKPMNCPHHTQIYAARRRSYKDLPLRYSEVTTVYRDEQAGELQGLTRVRAITQDDAHVFCRPGQIEQEVDGVLDIFDQFYKVFDFKLAPRLSLRDPNQPQKYLGDDKVWQRSESVLRKLIKKRKMNVIEQEGEAAFYGPKIDFIATDALKREWQLATIQLDFNMPTRFSLTFTDADGKEQTPVMIHRAVMGALERFMAILLEHYAGALPLWLSPTQAVVLPISDDQNEYAYRILEDLKKNNIRAEVDERSESIGKKIREAEIMKVPVMLIVGKKEVEKSEVSVRDRDGDKGSVALDKAIKDIAQKIDKKS
ncbi:MAG: threonine--tRNA ligase [bacterium]